MSAAMLRFPTDPLALVRAAVEAVDSGDQEAALDATHIGVHLATPGDPLRVLAGVVMVLALWPLPEGAAGLRTLLPAIADLMVGESIGEQLDATDEPGQLAPVVRFPEVTP